MPRKRKDCPICGNKSLLKLSNHLANVHQLSCKDRQSFLIRAKNTQSLESLFAEFIRVKLKRIP